MNNTNLYEINTRVWLKRFNKETDKPTLKNVPKSYWEKLANLEFDYVWLMGIWKTNDSVIKEYCFENTLVNEYRKALKDWNENDVIGSPYSIDSYELNPNICTEEELINLKELLNSMGIKLILDFISNHFSIHSSLLETHPYLFLSASEEIYSRDQNTYFRYHKDNSKIYAHGRDPFFPAWQDTVQVNYFNKETRNFMIDTLKYLTSLCDGVRCDMAMLSLNNVFDNTWKGPLNSGNIQKPEKEFWDVCISETKKHRNDFTFIGEAYWDLEYELQRLGFDFTYDKKLLDRLKFGYIKEIESHLKAEMKYQMKSVRFLENHDEARVLTLLGKEKAKAAAIIISTIPGMHMYFDGQLEGKRIKLPVQLGREPEEKDVECISEFYEKLFNTINSEVFRKGDWELIEPKPTWINNYTYQNFLAWHINYKNLKRVVIVNYSNIVSQCRIPLFLDDYPDKFKLKDILNDKVYFRRTDEANTLGLFIELGPYKSHIFAY